MTTTRPSLSIPTKRHPLVRQVRCVWRTLTGGSRVSDAQRRTLVACSGGADSCALALALAGTEGLVIAHVVHDLRPSTQALADLESARDLAAALHTPFAEAHVTCRAYTGNLEAIARRLRYAALAKLAAQYNCGFVATAHHADDQLETFLMRLARGSGPAGLACIPPRRPLAHGVQLIRPMLTASREACQQLCRDSNWQWREDATNTDTSRVRAALRANILPALKAIRPDIAARAAEAATLQRAAARILTANAAALWNQATQADNAVIWQRSTLAAAPSIILSELIRLAHRRLTQTGGLDKLSAVSLRPVVRAIKDSGGQTRSWNVGGTIIRLTRDTVEIAAKAL